MPNGPAHTIAGGLVGFITAIADHKNPEESSNPFLGMAIGAFAGKLPDILEPSLRNPHHRQFFHSVAVLIAVSYVIKKVYDWKPKSNFETLLRTTVLCAGAGYASHLILDGLTPRSLPLIGKI